MRYFVGVVLVPLILALLAVSAAAQSVEDLRWGGDAEGGAPFVEADPQDPSRVVGFDVEVAEILARGLGRTAALRAGWFHEPRSRLPREATSTSG